MIGERKNWLWSGGINLYELSKNDFLLSKHCSSQPWPFCTLRSIFVLSPQTPTLFLLHSTTLFLNTKGNSHFVMCLPLSPLLNDHFRSISLNFRSPNSPTYFLTHISDNQSPKHQPRLIPPLFISSVIQR